MLDNPMKINLSSVASCKNVLQLLCTGDGGLTSRLSISMRQNDSNASAYLEGIAQVSRLGGGELGPK